MRLKALGIPVCFLKRFEVHPVHVAKRDPRDEYPLNHTLDDHDPRPRSRPRPTSLVTWKRDEKGAGFERPLHCEGQYNLTASLLARQAELVPYRFMRRTGCILYLLPDTGTSAEERRYVLSTYE